MILACQSINGNSARRNAALRWFASLDITPREIFLEQTRFWIDPSRCFHCGNSVLHGWIDNQAELARALAIDSDDPACLYDKAVECWGEDADRHIHGHYAALSEMHDGALRLARSPWTAPPLNVVRDGEDVWISSLPSALRAMDLTLDLNRETIVDQQALNVGQPSNTTGYAGLQRVRLGTILHIAHGALREVAWYDVDAIPSAPQASDAERIAQCERLLQEAANAALRQAQNPAVALSGGLDSPIIAAELLKAQPSEKLTSITMVPDPEWVADDAPGTIGNEWPVVERFAAQHPNLNPVMADPAHGGIDYRYREIAQLAGTFNAAQSLLGPHHAIWEAAKVGGHDWLLTADLGNQSFSADGRWAYAEHFKRGRWRELVKLINGRRDDPRPLWRKILALGLMPHFPPAWRARLQRWLGGGAAKVEAQANMLSADARAAYNARAAKNGTRPAWSGFSFARDRRDAAQRDWQEQANETAEITLALELKYGVRYRDVTAYRPLIEYCLSLPTEMYARDGETRWLAKQLAAGRMPRAQYEDARHGLHHVDWLVRLRRDAPRLQTQIAAMRDHHWLAETLDLDRMERLLDALPDEEADNVFDALPYVQGIARAIVAGQWIGLNEGRNDF